MTKADLTRDYYADLELPPTADTAEIKKQFKKLALSYHPDRNPGRETEVTADFQRIQSAHEVLVDVQERAKYDANRIRTGSGFRNSHAGYSAGTSSGTKGNPWSNVSSQFPPPPKPPNSRTRPSAGAQRYTNNFKPPAQSAYQAAQNEPNSRQDTYNAFDRMHHRPKADPPGPGNTWHAPKPPPRGTPQSGREASNAQAQAQAEKSEAERLQAERAQAERARANARPQPSYDDYREPNTSHRRSQSTNASNRKGGFQPNTPGGDEPPAPRGAYFTARDKPTAPPPPPRQPPATFAANVVPDPLEQFRRKEVPSMETRSSQPYNTHGGEKFSLFDGPNISRSKSTREGNGKFDDGQVPRTGSDSTLNSPHRTRSSAQRPPPAAKPVYQSTQVDSSSSDDLPEMSSSRAGQSGNKSNDSAQRSAQQAPDAAKQAESTRKQGKIFKLRQWMDENPGQEPPPDGFPSDGPPLRNNQASPKPNVAAANNGANGQPSIFSFPVKNDTFGPTQPRSNGFSSSAENISTKFTPEDWDGKFEAGADYFKPAGGVPLNQPRSQSTSRSRGRSPPKARPTDPRFIPTGEGDIPTESPGGAKFSAEQWKETFKPQTFMPPTNPNIPPRPQSGRKRTGPNGRSTMGGRATVVDESDTSDEMPLFTGRRTSSPQASVPDPMDVDTPPVIRIVPQFVPSQVNEKLKVNVDPLKRPAATSTPSPVDQEDLTVNFEDLKIKGFSLTMPTPPTPPALPGLSDSEVPSREAFDSYVKRYAAYMGQWDAVYKQFLLHAVARQTQSDELMDKRWTDEKTTEAYRLSLKEDQAVLQRWTEITEKHAKVVKEYVIMKGRMASRDNRDGTNQVYSEGRPRKKTH